MSFNKAKEEYKWLQWKKREEEKLRELGVDEVTIEKLRQWDKESFNAERRYQEHLISTQDILEMSENHMVAQDIISIQQLLNAIENERLLNILLNVDKRMLHILLLKMMGYSIKEIANIMHLPEQTIYSRVNRLKKKIKNIL